MSAAPEGRYRDLVLRGGAASGALGALVLIVANAAHPRPSTSDVGDHEAFVRLAAESNRWFGVHVAFMFGSILFLGGLAALSYALREGRAAWLARLALVGAAAGTAVSLVRDSVDTAFGRVADDWASAAGAEKETLLHVASALDDVDFALFAVNVFFFFGSTFLLYGLAVAVSGGYPRPLGWVAVAAALGCLVVGPLQLITGPTVVTLFVFPAFAAVLSLWLLVMSVLLWRRT